MQASVYTYANHINIFGVKQFLFILGFINTDRLKNTKLTINGRKATIAAQHLMADILHELLRIKEPYHTIVGHIQNTVLWKDLKPREKISISEVAEKQSYKGFDIQLSYKVLKVLNTVPPPTHGWGKFPDITETSVGDDLERIVEYRNIFAHKGNCKLTESQFAQWFSKFQSVAKRMEDYLDKRNGEFTEKLSTLDVGSNDDNRDIFMNTIRFAKKKNDLLRIGDDNSNINGKCKSP